MSLPTYAIHAWINSYKRVLEQSYQEQLETGWPQLSPSTQTHTPFFHLPKNPPLCQLRTVHWRQPLDPSLLGWSGGSDQWDPSEWMGSIYVAIKIDSLLFNTLGRPILACEGQNYAQ